LNLQIPDMMHNNITETRYDFQQKKITGSILKTTNNFKYDYDFRFPLLPIPSKLSSTSGEEIFGNMKGRSRYKFREFKIPELKI